MTAWPRLSTARTAGLIYLTVVMSGIVSLGYVPSQLVDFGDAAQTVAKIKASESLFRVGIAAGFACFSAFLVLPFALYRLLGHVCTTAGKLMVVFAVASVPISLYNMANKLQVLTFLSGREYLDVLTTDQLNTAIMLSLAQYNRGVLVAEVFWGLWLLPLGYLVIKSGMLPRILGILLIAGCVGYLVEVFGSILFASYPSSVVARLATMPASVGEIGTCLWLLIMGAKRTGRPEIPVKASLTGPHFI